MKKVLLTIAAIALLAAPASAQVYSFWSDETMTSCDFFTEATYVMYDVYIMVEPGPEGVTGCEYRLEMPPGYNINQNNPGDVVSAALGSEVGAPGNSAAISPCQNATFVLWQYTMFVMTVEPGSFVLYPHDDTGLLSISSCIEPGRPIFEAAAYNTFGFNESCVVGTEESSWGAIKSMMD